MLHKWITKLNLRYHFLLEDQLLYENDDNRLNNTSELDKIMRLDQIK